MSPNKSEKTNKKMKEDTNEVVIEIGKGYFVQSEDLLYSIVKKIAAKGFKVLYITKRNPDMLRDSYPWIKNADGYWLTTSSSVEKYKTLDPSRIEFEVIQTIIEFVKTNKKSVVVIDSISLLMAKNDFDKLLEFVKSLTDFVSVHTSIFLTFAPLSIFREKEKALLFEYITGIKDIGLTDLKVKLLIKCEKCSKRVEDDIIFCPACGNALAQLKIEGVEKEKLEIIDEMLKEAIKEEPKKKVCVSRATPIAEKIEKTGIPEKKQKESKELSKGLKLVNRGKVPFKRTKMTNIRSRVVVAIVGTLLIFASISLILYFSQPQTKIKVDGRIDDWVGIVKYTDTTSVFNMDINLNEYSVYYENDRVYFYAKVSGSLFNGANNGYDALIIFVDTDANANTGYRIENLGADAKIEVSGYAGEIHSAVASRFIEQSASSKPELNYSAWENAGEVRVEKSTNIVEGYAKIAGLKNPVSLVLMRHYESSVYAEKRGIALVSKTEGSLVVYQNFIGNDVVNADENVLELRLIAKGKDVHVESISVANANVSLPKKDIAVNEELTVRCKAKSLSDGNAYAFAVSSVDTNVPYRIVGNGGKAYFGSLPSGIVIDGAFGDWQGVQKGVDVPGDASRNIDLREYASAIASNAYFYMAVDGTMLAGCEIPVLGARPQEGPVGPVVLKENLGMDVARVYIDLLNSTINTFNPAMISHGYLIELQGRNGQVISARAWKWENGVKAEEIQNPNIAHGLSDGKIEFSVSGTALQGLTNDTKFYFEMTNWLGEKDAGEFAYRAGETQHANTVANRGIKGTLRGPIHIDGNSQFTSDNGVVGGSGTQVDPYIIEGWDIDANGGPYGIWIKNTRAYFVVRNCTIYNATNYGNEPYGAGISLKNVMNGTLENNKCNGSRCGMYIYGSSQFNMLATNNVSGNFYGIWLYSSSNNTITGNTASSNINYGIIMDTSSSNNITNNNAFNSTYGLYLTSSSNNNITNNNAFNSTYGLYLTSSSNNNIITLNNVSGNSIYGIIISSSSNNIIDNNTVSGSNSGIYMSSSSNNNITRNKVSSNNQYGIEIYYTSNNTISNNTIYSNSQYGIYISQSTNTSITYNWICNNNGYGIYITSSSSGNSIHHNNFIGNNGAGKGISGNCQAYDGAGGNYWYDNSAQEGNYWSNWDGNDNGTANAYPIDGGVGASDWYPLGSPVDEAATLLPCVLVIAFLLFVARRRRIKPS